MKNCNCDNAKFSQERPKEGTLSAKIDLNKLRDILKEKGNETVYAYIVATVKWNDEEKSFVQTGCAPNFQGGVITLCTCKHWMRAGKECTDWEKGFWIAGFTKESLFPSSRENYLFYLMRVEKAFPSHKKLWKYLSEKNPKAKNDKNAHQHETGDLFQPKAEILDDDESKNDFNPSYYVDPCPNHVHREEWQNDIKYPQGKKKKSVRPASLLLGEEAKSYLWFDRKIRFNKELYKNTHPRTKKWAMAEFIKKLAE